FIIYQVGVIYQLATTPGGSYSINGADYLTASVLRLCNGSLPLYVIFVTLVAVAFGWGLKVLSQRDSVSPRVMAPMILESVIYALLFSTTIHFFQSLPHLLTVASQLAVAGPTSAWEMVFQSFG